MPALLYASCLADALSGAIDFAGDRFKVLLAGNGYTPKKTDSRRSDVADEVDGIGYPQGGPEVAVSVFSDPRNDRTVVVLGGVTLPDATLKARHAVYYKANGGDPSADELVAAIDFGTDVVSTNGDFTLTASSIELRGAAA